LWRAFSGGSGAGDRCGGLGRSREGGGRVGRDVNLTYVFGRDKGFVERQIRCFFFERVVERFELGLDVRCGCLGQHLEGANVNSRWRDCCRWSDSCRWS
jgi:hypothetical protein